ncbi:hypothetical protein [Enterobacter hormaechei]|uniref:hypothetical protein n=2 Tax=Enterobacter TaxID=547 RepID=UPI0034CDA9C3
MENKNLASIDVTDSARLRGKVDHTTWHACKSRLKMAGLPQTPKRIGFLLWLEYQQHHVFTFEDYVNKWGYNNAHLHLNEYEKNELIHQHDGYFLSQAATSYDSPFRCKCCKSINLNKILKAKERIINEANLRTNSPHPASL